jgi:hypothetical protein
MAAPTYSFRNINVPGSAGSSAGDINNNGQILGSYSGSDPSLNNASQGFRLGQGAFNTIDFPGATQTVPSGFNDADKIVGQYVDSSGTRRSFVLYGGNFGTFALAGATQTYVVDTDNIGHIIGSYVDTEGTFHGFLWYRGTTIYDIVAFPGAVWTEPLGIYDQLNLVGRYSKSGPPYVWEGFVMKGSPRLSGSYTPINVPGALATHATDLNAKGIIIGWYEDSANLIHSFVLSEGNFSTIDFPGAPAGTTLAFGLTDVGQIVGQYMDPLGGGTLGFLATPVIEAAAAQKHLGSPPRIPTA